MSRCILYMESLLSCLQFCESCHRKSILSYRETGGQWDGGICKSPAWSSGSCSLFPELILRQEPALAASCVSLHDSQLANQGSGRAHAVSFSCHS